MTALLYALGAALLLALALAGVAAYAVWVECQIRDGKHGSGWDEAPGRNPAARKPGRRRL